MFTSIVRLQCRQLLPRAEQSGGEQRWSIRSEWHCEYCTAASDRTIQADTRAIIVAETQRNARRRPQIALRAMPCVDAAMPCSDCSAGGAAHRCTAVPSGCTTRPLKSIPPDGGSTKPCCTEGRRTTESGKLYVAHLHVASCMLHICMLYSFMSVVGRTFHRTGSNRNLACCLLRCMLSHCTCIEKNRNGILTSSCGLRNTAEPLSRNPPSMFA